MARYSIRDVVKHPSYMACDDSFFFPSKKGSAEAISCAKKSFKPYQGVHFFEPYNCKAIGVPGNGGIGPSFSRIIVNGIEYDAEKEDRERTVGIEPERGKTIACTAICGSRGFPSTLDCEQE